MVPSRTSLAQDLPRERVMFYLVRKAGPSNIVPRILPLSFARQAKQNQRKRKRENGKDFYVYRYIQTNFIFVLFIRQSFRITTQKKNRCFAVFLSILQKDRVMFLLQLNRFRGSPRESEWIL